MKLCWLLLALICATFFTTSCRKRTSFNPVAPPPVGGVDTSTTPPVDPPDPPPIPEPIAYNQVAVHQRIGTNVGGYYEALPPGYDTSGKTYPLLLFLHGGGELGDGSDTALPKILKNSLTRRLHEKNFPTEFVVNSDTFSFIIVSPQFAEWPVVKDVHDVMKHALGKYRVDSTRIYLSGLSMGGAGTWLYAGSDYGTLLAAIVPICGASWADSATARQIAANEIPAWAFHNEDDQAVTVNSTKRYARLINAENPKYPVRVTLWPTGGHDAWTKASDPDYREEGKNMYEWMLQYVRK
jgi:predicted peptidase